MSIRGSRRRTQLALPAELCGRCRLNAMGALHHEAGTRFCVRCLARLPGGNAWISGW